jgi:hypothetical protein
MERLAAWPVYFRYHIGPAPMAGGPRHERQRSADSGSA